MSKVKVRIMGNSSLGKRGDVVEVNASDVPRLVCLSEAALVAGQTIAIPPHSKPAIVRAMKPPKATKET